MFLFRHGGMLDLPDACTKSTLDQISRKKVPIICFEVEVRILLLALTCNSRILWMRKIIDVNSPTPSALPSLWIYELIPPRPLWLVLAIDHSIGKRFASQNCNYRPSQPFFFPPFSFLFISISAPRFCHDSDNPLKVLSKSPVFLRFSRKYRFGAFSPCAYPTCLGCPNQRVKTC